MVFARQAETLAGNGRAVARQRLSLSGEISYRSTSGAKGDSDWSHCVVMYIGPMRTVRGDKEWEAN